jgi:RNA polymerase sigma-70 factor, ECF subfamily
MGYMAIVPSPAPAPGFVEQLLAHASALYSLARHLDPSAAEDLVQETFARALQAEERFEPGTQMRAWLFRILRNLFIGQVRLGRRHPTRSAGDGLDEEAGPGWPRDDLELEAMRRLIGTEIEAALATLGEEARTAILLDLEGLTEAEVAEVMGCAVGTVKSRLSRARAALRRKLADYARRGAP